MTSIMNFEDEIKRRSIDRPSDIILNSINRLYDAKLSGALNSDELSKIIVLEGDLFANRIKQGKVSIDEIESAEAFITGFARKGKDNYFSFKHSDLDRAAKIFLEGDYVALEELNKRTSLSSPVFDSESYSKGFKKIA